MTSATDRDDDWEARAAGSTQRSARAGDSAAQPAIDYLAKDYASFREAMLARLALVAPDWTERSPADLGVTIVEILAYAGDYLSYYQDAVGTEAYLQTARRRLSVKRHARLRDYQPGEQCNARTWVFIEVAARSLPAGAASSPRDRLKLPAGTELMTRVGDVPPAFSPQSFHYAKCLDRSPAVFRTMHEIGLDAALNALTIVVPPDQPFDLPRGATSATLKLPASLPLGPGDLLLFEQVRDPASGRGDRADPALRHVVRLSAPPQWLVEAGNREGTLAVVSWFSEDALPFALPVARRIGGVIVDDLAVARGNIVLADHGSSGVYELAAATAAPYRPAIPVADPIFAAPFDPADAATRPARWAAIQDPCAALAGILLHEYAPFDGDARSARPVRVWRCRGDLLNSGRFAPDFVFCNDDGESCLRFGDGVYGRRPVVGARFRAVCRHGPMQEGNIGIDRLAHIVTNSLALREAVTAVRNPLPALGAQPAEPTARIRRFAPVAYRRRGRCVLPEDFVDFLCARPAIRNAVASRSWNGTGYTISIRVQPAGGSGLSQELSDEIRRWLEPYLLVGFRVEILPPKLVPLDIGLVVRAKAGAQGRCRPALVAALGAGAGGFFAPGRFTFGQPVDLTLLLAAAAVVPEVANASAERFRRLGEPLSDGLGSAILAMAPDEIACAVTVPGARELGQITLRFEAAS